MSVWIRRGVWGLLGLFVVLAALAAWLVMSFDSQRAKSAAIDWMKAHDRTLAIDGPIHLSVFPRLAVKLSQARLSEAGRTDLFASIDEAGLAVDVLPLLRGEVVVDRVRAKGVRVTYLRDAKGRSNIDDLVKPQPPAGQPPAKDAGGGSGTSMRFGISGIELTDVRARVKDDVAKVDGELWLQSLTAGRLADKATAPVKVAARFDFKQPAAKGEVAGETKLTLDMDTSSAALRGMNLRVKGDVPGASAVDATVQGSLAWDGARKRIDAEDLKLQFAGHAGGFKSEDSRVAIDRFAFDPERKALDLRKLSARIRGTQGGEPLTLELDWPELAVNGDRLGGSAFAGKVARGGAMPLSATFKSTAPTGSFDAVRLPGFVAQWNGSAPQRKLEGTLRADLTLKPGEPSLAFDKLDLQARIEEPKLPAYAVVLRGNAVGSTKRSSWNLQGQLNQSPFTSEGAVMLAGVTPQVTAQARFESLDLNRLLGPEAPAGKGSTSAGSAGDTPVDLAGLRKVNGQFGLRAGHFVYRQYRIDDAAIDATLDGGMLRVTQLAGRAWGGQLAATAFADARASRVAVKGAANGVNVNALIKDVAAKDWIEGTGRVTVDLDTAGRTVQEMKSRLKGNAALQVRDGAVKGINLAKVLRQAKAALSMKQDAAMKANQAEKTDFTELSATFQVADGVARNRDLDLKSPFLRLGGEGAIDIGHSRIDYVARATVTATAKGQDAGDLGMLKGATVPVRVTGPLDQPDWHVQWSAVAAGVVQQQLKEKLGEQLGLKPPAGAASGTRPEDVLKNKLKGLFK
jgi:AsmA protein